jgi:hypothetical protein
MWNKHLQEVIDELVTTIKEMDPSKQARVLTLVKKKLAASQSPDDQRTLTNPLHEWLLPPGDPQRVAQIPTMEQRVIQRVNKNNTSIPTPLIRVTDAPAIMAAPNPTTKRTLRLTPQSHLRQTRKNIPGSVPPITRVNRRHVPIEPSTPTPPPAPRMARWRPRRLRTLDCHVFVLSQSKAAEDTAIS